ncbi:hypothetical protein [Maritimibacter sp. HL-12]|uniref:hypothetical protein n=1 Tax=Maritimibacter sp. HL-12 TaxID=1162418 RepID=UPI0034E85B4D
MKPVYPPLTPFDQSAAMKQMQLDFDRPRAADLSSPEIWLKTLFSSKAARDGKIIRRSLRDIRRYCGLEAFLAEVNRRGYRAFENSGQVIIFCNHAPIRRVSETANRP